MYLTHVQLPPARRLAVVQIVAVAWNSYLTWKANKMWRPITRLACVDDDDDDDDFTLICSVYDMGRSGLTY